MKITFDTDDIHDATGFGEILRDYCFTPSDQVGCYSTFDLRPEFKKLEGAVAHEFIENFLKSPSFWGEWYNTPDICAEDKKMQEEIYKGFMQNIYSNGAIIVAWHWDGDGCLLIGDLKRIAYNSDCKKSYGWEWANHE